MAPQRIAISREDLMHACVVYTRPELLAFEHIIRLRSSNTLRVRGAPSRPTLAAVPPEILLRIRASLQTALSVHLKQETAAAMTRYAGAVVRSLCSECAAYNAGVFGDDVWNWIENGCKVECACRAKYAGTPREAAEVSSFFLLRTLDGRHTNSRREWLETYLSAVHLSGRPVCTDVVPSVLDSLLCRRHPRAQEILAPANPLTTDVVLVGTDEHDPATRTVSTKASSNDRVVIEPVLPQEHRAALVLNNVVRELNIFPASGPPICDDTIFGINGTFPSPCASPPSHRVRAIPAASEYTFRLTNLPASHRRSYSSLSAPAKCPLQPKHHARMHTTTHQAHSGRLITILCIAFFIIYRHAF